MTRLVIALSVGLSWVVLAAIGIWIVAPASALVGGAEPLLDASTRPEVMIVGSRGNSCTGTLIARDLVLTAAHCVPPNADYKLVQLDANRQPSLRDTARVERHPQFSMSTFLNHRATADALGGIPSSCSQQKCRIDPRTILLNNRDAKLNVPILRGSFRREGSAVWCSTVEAIA
jgi:hypothetical protein